ncbi:RNA polymerase sigma-70 factor [Draconibacterium sp.]
MKQKKLELNVLELLKKGDILAFDAIYEMYCRRLFCFVLKYVKQKVEAEEIVQEVFVKIWESRHKIDVYASFDSFLFTIAYNSTISLLRKRVTEKKYIDFLISQQQEYIVNDSSVEIQFNELNDKVQLLLNELTPRQKEIFQLSRVEGLTHEEIAKKLNISANTVKNHMVTVLSFLRKSLDNNLLVNLLFISLFL